MQALVDKTIPFMSYRWTFTGFLFVLFWLRVLFLGGFYVVAYTASIYQLNIFLLFLSPKFLPEDFPSGILNDDDDSILPLSSTASSSANHNTRTNDEEFRPFIRRLPEYNFWMMTTQSLIYALSATFISFFDIPVFWPVLVIYFLALFTFTMRKQIQHMITHRYIPFDFGKKRFGG